jgi:membrane protein implicated in regulation of membrane protease activity
MATAAGVPVPRALLDPVDDAQNPAFSLAIDLLLELLGVAMMIGVIALDVSGWIVGVLLVLIVVVAVVLSRRFAVRRGRERQGSPSIRQ